jgi:hypothetical protein
MNFRHTVVSLLATLACGAALAGDPPASATKSAQANAGANNAIEEIVVQARAPERIMPLAPRPEISAPRFEPPPLTIEEPKELVDLSAGKQERLADAGTKPKL